MRHIDELQIAGTAVLLCVAMFGVSAVAPKDSKVSKGVTTFTEAPETAAEAEAQAQAEAEEMAFLFISQRVIMMIPAALTGIMTADPTRRIPEIIMITRIVPEMVLQMAPGMVLQTRILPITEMALIAVTVLILPIIPVTGIRLITRMSPRIPQGMTPLKISPTRILPLLIRVRNKFLVHGPSGDSNTNQNPSWRRTFHRLARFFAASNSICWVTPSMISPGTSTGCCFSSVPTIVKYARLIMVRVPPRSSL